MMREFGGLQRGFTLVELMIVVALIALLATIAVPNYMSAVGTARNAKVIGEIKMIAMEIDLFEMQNGRLPLDLSEVGRAGDRDPWGSPYEYLSFENVKGNGKKRKDKNMVPINSTYDLYSRGPDGKTVSPLTAKKSHDDIIRADDGAFIGVAANY